MEAHVPEVHFLNVHFESAIESVVAGTTLRFKRVGNTLGAPVYVISDGQGSPFAKAPAPPQKVEVLSVNAIVRDGSREIDAVLEAIDMALSSEASPERRAQIRFHEASGLLIVQGTRSQIDTAINVVNRMTEDREAQRLDDLQRESERIRLDAEVAELEAELEIASQEQEMVQLQLDEITRMFENGRISRGDMLEAQLTMARREANVNMIRGRLHAAAAQLDLFERASEAGKTTKEYDLGKAARVSDQVDDVLDALGKLQGPRIESHVYVSGSTLSVTASKAQHAVVAAMVEALAAAASGSQD